MMTSTAFAGILQRTDVILPERRWGYAMPLIDPTFIKKVGFLYKSREAAENHELSGGTCFVLAVPLEPGSKQHIPYLVTNRHVVWNGNAPVARFNRRDGNPLILDYTPDQWICHPNDDDLALVCAWPDLDYAVVDASAVFLEEIITPDIIRHNEIGVGDEVFMIGRFLNHQGVDSIKPAVRFGNISMMAEPINHNGYGRSRRQESFAVEMRSRAGFSGSPVYVYRTMSSDIFHSSDFHMAHDFTHGLLGVNWGHILDDKQENSWLNGVVPAWKIQEVLDVPKLKSAHESARRQIILDSETKPVTAVESAFEGTENPRHREDFNRLLGEAAKKKPQAG